ncbi:Piso0_005906 [Millerozyma farinosa CBS 7064]|uniref:Piso0_005906 protein n=1 Tax=Pichia sorbitophila (strain ATCC MYA-4447 / BCRC 22081 / CBS 7064 / NBRC 10061 / NRRL Y-12695) TaxID=559304 RepID=G8Y384_PICSO|nr:Piso0_005906 [Millerozyma farinosa CBS 7064]
MLRVGKYELLKKNRRPKRSCSFCRRKKVKCDQRIPCSTCVRYGNNDCDLRIPPPEVINTPKRKLVPKSEKPVTGDTGNRSPSGKPTASYTKELFEKGTNGTVDKRYILFSSDEETVNIHEGKHILGTGPADRQTFRALSWVSLLLTDKYYIFLLQFCKSLKDFDTILDDMNTYAKDCEKFKSDTYLSRNNHSSRQKIANNSREETMLSKDGNKNKKFYNDSLAFKEKQDKLDLLKYLKDIFPSTSEVNFLLKIFFSSIHGVIPIVDESNFREKISQILEEQYATIDIKKKTDFATVGILFSILRLSAISASSLSNALVQEERTSNHSENERYYIEKTSEYFNAAKLCLENVDLYQCNNIPALQLLIFIYVLHLYSPEEDGGLDGRPTKMIFSNIIQLALFIGLNNDPFTLPPRFRHPKSDNISRKIWCFIVYMDICNSIASGDPLSTASIPSDTQAPMFSELESNNESLCLEKEIIENLQKRHVMLGYFSDVLFSLLNNNKGMKLKDLSIKICSIESLNKEVEVIIKEFTMTSKIITISNTMDILHYFNLNSFLFSLYFKLFLHCEKTKNHVFSDHYIIKYMDCSLRGPYRVYFYILKNPAIFDNSCFKLFITPNLLHMMQRSFTCILSLLIRLKFLKEKMKKSEHESGIANKSSSIIKCDNVLSLLLRCFKVLTDITHTLFSSYYMAWRFYKVSTFIISMVLSDEFNENVAQKVSNFYMLISEDTLDQIIKLLCDIENEEHIDKSLNTSHESLNYKDPGTDLFSRFDLEKFNDIWPDPSRNESYFENEDLGNYPIFDFFLNSGLDFDLDFEATYEL